MLAFVKLLIFSEDSRYAIICLPTNAGPSPGLAAGGSKIKNRGQKSEGGPHF